jgi:glycosyltransferase involved in cell wall biosynthesis
MLRRAALLLAQTDHEARLYLEAGGTPAAVHLLPLPLDLRAVPDLLEPRFLRRRMDLDDRVPLALFLGRIHYLKGLDILVQALASSLSTGNVALAIVGRDDGQWDEIASKHADLLGSGAIRFLGPLYGEERFHAYADADVFCLTPRHWEETSLASLEAAAVATPIVVTEQADVPGLSSSGGGFVVPLEETAIRDAVLAASADSAAAGARARALVERQHSSDAVVDRLESLLQIAIGHGTVPE